MKTAVVILNWNGRSFLEKFLPGLLSSVKGDSRVIVADNGSDDGSLEYLAQAHPQLRTIALDRNYGFTGGYNRAFDQIEAQYFLLINSDIEVDPDWLYPLEEWMDLHADCGACAPKILSYEQRDSFEYAGAAGGCIDRFGFPFCRGRIMQHIEKDEGQYDMPDEAFWASGACLMVRASAWRELGGLDERFFAHMEEIDFCWRAKLAGWKIHIVPRSRVWHVGGGTLPNNSPFKLLLNYRNNLLMLGQNLPRTLALLSLMEMMDILEPVDEVSTDEFHASSEIFRGEDGEIRKSFIEGCVALGHTKASWTIFRRMLLDGCSAIVYLLRGDWKFFKAVVNAHREYRAMKGVWDEEADRQWLIKAIEDREHRVMSALFVFDPDGQLDNFGGKAFKIKGMYSRFMVLQNMLKGKSVFEELRKNFK